jgi:Domain of unknown function (DUF4965)/Domain of unknown function (DUF5127)/Domain of unknown function (DUF1793)/Domain of unknown function (DUF4964)
MALAFILAAPIGSLAIAADPIPPLRPPAVPLVACDPYFSIWSRADRLTDAPTTHWTGKPQTLISLLRVDGVAYRLMGAEPRGVPALRQKSLVVTPTRSIYEMEGAGLSVTLTFLTPALPDDLDVLARPVTYLLWSVRSTDGRPHRTALFMGATAELAVDQPSQTVVWGRQAFGDVLALRVGTDDQPVLQKEGDDLRIDWGHAFLAAPVRAATGAIGSLGALTRAFAAGRPLPKADDTRMPRAAADETPTLALVFDLGRVTRAVSRHATLAYDDELAIEYMGASLRPYWRRNGAQIGDLLQQAEAELPRLEERSRKFDDELLADLRAVGGERYARLVALSYRQAQAANKIVADASGQPLMFPKENFSNGCIGTVDVIYPMLPQWLLLNPTLAKAALVPVLAYGASPRWKWPFAPHDLGTYPKANGQVYGGGERTEEDQMPVEESGNMIILVAALAHLEGNTHFADAYWPQLTRWADYLADKGFDPENQLCTDDFAGHLAHNVNLSAKAIVALGAYAKLAAGHGDEAAARRYGTMAKELAARWVKEAADGDHFRLTFDRPGTWSQKYNLVWDRILGLGLFPPAVAKKELAYYRKVQQRYGLPLDVRKTYTKIDWTVWTATLTGDRDDFEAIVDPLYDFVNATPQRVPLTDWYETSDARHVGFVARSVVGGLLLPMLTKEDVWRKWAGRDQTRVESWAPLPEPPVIEEVVATGRAKGAGADVYRYTFEAPAGEWFLPDYDARTWKEGAGAFGTSSTPGAIVRTEWKNSDVWLRRMVELSSDDLATVRLFVYHDDGAEIYVNGVLAAALPGASREKYVLTALGAHGRAALKVGQNLLAVHCHNDQGEQGIDVGFAKVTPKATTASREQGQK